MQKRPQQYQLIEDYGIIGNTRTTALIAKDGSIDFLCFPRFDSPSVFARILDKKKGGYFSIEPEMSDVSHKQLYIPGTAVLITRFFSDEGIAEITDYMPLRDETCISYNAIVRKIKAVRGRVSFRATIAPSFDYAREKHEIIRQEDSLLFRADDGTKTELRVQANIKMHVRANNAYGKFTLEEGEKACIVLESVDEGQEEDFAPLSYFEQETYFETISYWQKWVGKSTYKGRWLEVLQRSVITLKLLTSSQFGSVIAAATFSLPEELGGARNWDYRYTWIRDAAFTMFAFLKLGFKQEAVDFLSWIVKHSKSSDLHLIYRIDGTSNLEEEELPNLEGYKQSPPVRIGNEANDQLQLDIYGELLDTIYIFNKHQPITHELWDIICKEVHVVIEKWKEPDHGIWEIRNEKHEFLHSRLMCWVAMDRAIKIGEQRSFPFPQMEWITVRDEIYNNIYHDFWNEKLGCWAQYKDGKTVSDTVDASVLLMPLVHFITPTEPRWIKTMEAVNLHLRTDVLVYRYNNEDSRIDGLEGKEGTFTMCSFWYIECLAKAKKLGEAVENFEKMLGYGNHLGLFAEQISKKGEHLGNFPQAFTHLGLISAALELDKQLNRLK